MLIEVTGEVLNIKKPKSAFLNRIKTSQKHKEKSIVKELQ